MKRISTVIIITGLLCIIAAPLHAARISDLGDTQIMDQVARFFCFEDGAVRLAVAGGLLLGLSCGLLGGFIVVRKMALMGDTLSHAVLPGVAIGFLWNMTKDPIAIFIGAIAAGVLGALTVQAIRRTTHLKEDTSMGMVLAGFYGLGICLMTFIQGMEQGNFSGLDKFLFGQAAALGADDIKLMSGVTLLAVLLVIVFYKEFSLVSFDRAFASIVGLPVKILDAVFMLLLASAIVISLQAVGVVLVSAMLITPAATAYLLAHRFSSMLFLSAGLGMLAGFGGSFLSFLGNNLPTGPFMVLSATSLFVAAWIFAPQHGMVPKWFRFRKQRRLSDLENLLKHFYQVYERRELDEPRLQLRLLAERRGEPVFKTERAVSRMVGKGLAEWVDEQKEIFTQERGLRLTPDGLIAAKNVVRRHRLWEYYLTKSAHFADDHVHIDAERVEHILSQPALEHLDRRMGYPEFDPHGKPIPREGELKEEMQS